MNGRKLLPLCGLLAACNDTAGDWAGECDLGEVEMTVSVSLSDTDGDITGTGTMGYANEDGEISESVTVTGVRDGSTVSLELQPDTVGEMEIDASLDGDTLDGSCMWATIEGSALLER